MRDAVRVAISYADIFDYPLTREEVRLWAPYRLIRTPLAEFQGWFPRRYTHLTALRKQREAWSKEKWVQAQRGASILKLIPTLTLVGATGGLARDNAKEDDDIDFLLITAPRTLWMTRALSTILLDIFRLRRQPNDTKVRNLICLNMFMSEDGLAVPPEERDLFTAHEVLLMRPLWERGGAYQKFLSANQWVKRFLPNAWEEKCQMIEDKWPIPREKISIWRVVWRWNILESLAKAFQLWYMRKRRSTEVVSDTLIRFHPHDARIWIKRALGRRLAKYNIPLDKIFYGR